ncbi:MAG TPA: metal ABC transporter permease [Candidatus Kapabacteria bacterium]|jgi:manganese/zinc/iron transport system permease protein|nr:metal ABC transporter permease [Candidatus Kapabacteria bacterium]
MDTNAFWIMLTGALAAGACALVGCFLVLRKMSMLGDAISHAVLPGIALAFLFSGGRETVPMLIGAGVLGVVTAFAIESLHRAGKLQQDASIGVTFTWLFAVGVILITRYASQVDLDQDCVLYGEILFVPLDPWITAGGTSLGPRAVWTLGSVFVLNLVFVVFGYKELKITSFDPGLAASIGISATLWHYLLMGMVSLTTVGAFESVGAILVVAMLIAPPATAYLLTDRLDRMLIYAVGIGVLSAIGGFYLASWLDGSIAGAMAVVAGAFFTLALLFSPTHGVLTERMRSSGGEPEPAYAGPISDV